MLQFFFLAPTKDNDVSLLNAVRASGTDPVTDRATQYFQFYGGIFRSSSDRKVSNLPRRVDSSIPLCCSTQSVSAGKDRVQNAWYTQCFACIKYPKLGDLQA